MVRIPRAVQYKSTVAIMGLVETRALLCGIPMTHASQSHLSEADILDQTSYSPC